MLMIKKLNTTIQHKDMYHDIYQVACNG